MVLSICGSLYSFADHIFQVLSNYANDLGDGVKGTDQHRERTAHGGQRLIPIGR